VGNKKEETSRNWRGKRKCS